MAKEHPRDPQVGPDVPALTSVVRYTLIVVLVDMVVFVLLLLAAPALRSDPTQQPDEAMLIQLFALTTGIMFTAGILGGCLYNLRGLSKHASLGDFDKKYLLSYYLRPLSAGVSGLIVFFLLLGGALTLNAGTSGGTPETIPAWSTLIGRLPYIAFSLLAGYGSHEFMLKMKDLADSVFALGRKDD